MNLHSSINIPKLKGLKTKLTFVAQRFFALTLTNDTHVIIDNINACIMDSNELSVNLSSNSVTLDDLVNYNDNIKILPIIYNTNEYTTPAVDD